MKTWVLAIVLFGATGVESWRHVEVPSLTEVACLEMLGSVAKANPKGRGLAFCYDGALGLERNEAVPTVAFEGR